MFRATEGLQPEYGQRRVIDTPLAESSIVGIAIGLALADLRPIAEIQFADFIHSAFDQIVSEAAKIHYRSNGDFRVPLVIRAVIVAMWLGGFFDIAARAADGPAKKPNIILIVADDMERMNQAQLFSCSGS